jgi:ABC transporter substrate binding protein
MEFLRRRREFIALLGGVAAAWPIAALAQARRPIREHGYVEGRDLDIAYKFADGFLDRLPALAEELVRLRPDAIMAPTTISAMAARAASATVPIVCPLLENPIRVGLVASENQPGGNVTGLLRYVDGLAGKHVELARELLPGVTRIGVLINAGSLDPTARRDVEAAGSALAVDAPNATESVQGPHSKPSAATSASFSDCKTETPPRWSRIHPCLAHARSCLLVLSRDWPMIWLISCWVIATWPFAAGASIAAAVSRSNVLASLVGKSRNVMSWTCWLVRRSRAHRISMNRSPSWGSLRRNGIKSRRSMTTRSQSDIAVASEVRGCPSSREISPKISAG